MVVKELIAVREHLDPKRGTLTYDTNVEAGPGIIIHADPTGEYDMMITNQAHDGGKVSVKMRPISRPAKKFKVGDVVAKLILIG